MLLPVLDVDIGDTADEEFEFTFVEDVDEVWGDELVEAGDKGIELLFHSLLDPPLRDKPRAVSKWSGKKDQALGIWLLTRHIPSCSHS